MITWSKSRLNRSRFPSHGPEGVDDVKKLIVFALIGFAAQLVDGSLGMAYGVTSTSLLLLFGIAPAVASASVHMAEVVTTAASGLSHLKFGNVDKTVVMRLIIPGSIGAFTGACFLSNLPGERAKPYIAAFLFVLGIYVMSRFLFGKENRVKSGKKPPTRLLIPLGLVAGFADSTGGGGWGPLSTPVLLSRDRKSTRLNSSHVKISYAVFCLNPIAALKLDPPSLHDALPICIPVCPRNLRDEPVPLRKRKPGQIGQKAPHPPAHSAGIGRRLRRFHRRRGMGAAQHACSPQPQRNGDAEGDRHRRHQRTCHRRS